MHYIPFIAVSLKRWAPLVGFVSPTTDSPGISRSAAEHYGCSQEVSVFGTLPTIK